MKTIIPAILLLISAQSCTSQMDFIEEETKSQMVDLTVYRHLRSCDWASDSILYPGTTDYIKNWAVFVIKFQNNNKASVKDESKRFERVLDYKVDLETNTYTFFSDTTIFYIQKVTSIRENKYNSTFLDVQDEKEYEIIFHACRTINIGIEVNPGFDGEY